MCPLEAKGRSGSGFSGDAAVALGSGGGGGGLEGCSTKEVLTASKSVEGDLDVGYRLFKFIGITQMSFIGVLHRFNLF